jgi:hypothetical protein
MNKRGLLMLLLAVCAAAVTVAVAEDEVGAVKKEKAAKVKKSSEAEKPKKEVVELQELALSGTISKTTKAGKSGKPESATYKLVLDDGTSVSLPNVKGGKDQAAVDLEGFAGRKVTVKGMGMKKENAGKTVVLLRKITQVEAAGPADIE